MADANDLLSGYVLALADDQMILGQRDAEWCSRAPILEEDIAFANIALDEIGHAGGWYSLLAELAGEDERIFPDRLVYFRSAADFRNVQMAELPRGDFAFAMLRQYFLDSVEYLRLEALVGSPLAPLAEVAGKHLREETYHLHHTRAWLPRLGLGTEESHARLQRALDELWPSLPQLLAPLPAEAELSAAGLVPASQDLRDRWEAEALDMLKRSGLAIPSWPDAPMPGREAHTPHLKTLLADLQSVARLDPEAEW